ncbi:hypothetical protein BGW38_003337 [Lunasporangiospora selenospora]|uniref:Major facilitator superfamily (MFS) profile domain-containing protein n=1 Tax=Lunasporangiospora selenospora TaxID=979761 RepID=A0A9P6G0Y1_9FUNG|nr:hypothetical protein BGW38_003337 [Lunasporangiospora selenospora]
MAVVTYLKGLVVPESRTDDPKDWSRSKKNTVVFTIAYCAFVAPLASSIYMPAVLQVKNDFGTTESLVSATLSVYVLFMGIMPVFWASLCDYTGRRPIYLVSMLIFILGSLFAAVSRNIWVFFVMRAIQAFGSSSVLAVGGGSLSDIFHSGERGAAFGIYYLGPLVAPVVGPIIGGVISDRAGWRYTMWLLLGTAVVAFLLVLFILPETYRHTIIKATDAQTPSVPVTAVGVGIGGTPPPHHHHGEEMILGALESIPPNNLPQYFNTEELADPESSITEHHDQDSVEKQGIEMPASPANTVRQRDPEKVASSSEEYSKEADNRQAMDDKDHDSLQASPASVTPPTESGPKRPKSFNPLRPLLCLRKPTNTLLVTFNALSLGAQFCMSNTLPISLSDVYNLNESIIGVCFCAAGVGSVLGSLIGGRYSDYVLRQWLIRREVKKELEQRQKEARMNGVPEAEVAEIVVMKEEVVELVTVATRAPPEVRLHSVWVGIIVLPVGLMLYGWSIQNRLTLGTPLAGIFLKS